MSQTKNSIKYVITSLLFAFFACVAMYFFRTYLNTGEFLTDVGGISTYASIFGTLYGIAVALVLLEVWNQFNKTSSLMDKEALGLERLFGLIVYFRDFSLE